MDSFASGKQRSRSNIIRMLERWMHENEGTWNPWPRVETEKQKRKRLIKEQERQEKKNKKK